MIMPHTANPLPPTDSKPTSSFEAARSSSHLPPDSKSGPVGKLGPAMKTEICNLRARGHSLQAIAQIVGVSDRTIRRERRRDPDFDRRLGEDAEKIADACLDALMGSVRDKPHLALPLYRLAYPDRYHYKPDTVHRKQYDKAFGELIKLFASIATPVQMQKLEQLLGPDRAPPRS